MEKYKATLKLDGLKLIEEVFNRRHQIVHEGRIIPIEDYQLNSILLLFQDLAVSIASKFCNIVYRKIERQLVIKKEKVEEIPKQPPTKEKPIKEKKEELKIG